MVTGAYFHAVTSGIPEAFLGLGTIMAYYTARDLHGLFAFLQSQEFADAVAEGEQWFGNFNPTDFEDITGNIYVVDSVTCAVDEAVEPEDAVCDRLRQLGAGEEVEGPCIFVELTEVRAVLSERLMRALAESFWWDLGLPYVRRDVYQCQLVVS